MLFEPAETFGQVLQMGHPRNYVITLREIETKIPRSYGSHHPIIQLFQSFFDLSNIAIDPVDNMLNLCSVERHGVTFLLILARCATKCIVL